MPYIFNLSHFSHLSHTAELGKGSKGGLAVSLPLPKCLETYRNFPRS